jgi:hypothetical protein
MACVKCRSGDRLSKSVAAWLNTSGVDTLNNDVMLKACRTDWIQGVQVSLGQGCQIFRDTIYQNVKNIPNGNK